MSLMRFKKMHVLLQTAKVLMLLKKRINIENDKNCRSCRKLGLGGVPYVYMRHVSMLMAPKQVKLAMGPGISCLQSSCAIYDAFVHPSWYTGAAVRYRMHLCILAGMVHCVLVQVLLRDIGCICAS